ncbi:MAG: hypothetical protein ACRD2S_08655 [Terriglobales bacterium]
MRVSRMLATLFLVLTFSSLLFAADLTGKWMGPMESGGEAVFTLKLANNSVTGSMTGIDGKEYPIIESKLDGDNISFTVASQWQGNPVKLFVKGKVAGEQMKLNIAADNGYWSTDATVTKEAKK